ncbi:MAG TPA: MarR family transcriptional regulator [Methanocorpusculum sp.]|nr:MarR family transcriptional regulator [Methanocorpusculum sp.]
MAALQLNEKETRVLAYIREKPDGAYQSELWKDLGMDSRTCSRILKKFEDGGYVEREVCKKDGTRTYLVRIVKTEKAINPMLLMAGKIIVPCVACSEECDAEHCKILEDWVYELVFSEMK